MSEKSCNCQEIKKVASMMAEYLRSLKSCLSNGEPILKKDINDIRELLDKYDELVK